MACAKTKIINAKHTSSKSKSSPSALAREILGYLKTNPRACDSLVGIARWWLLRQRIETMTSEVQSALDELVKLRFVLRTSRPDGLATYRLNRRKLKTIRSLLATSKPTTTL